MKGFLFKTILIYELFAFLVWNILVRTEADFEQWAYDNIHTIAYIWWATTLLVVTLSFCDTMEPGQMAYSSPNKTVKGPQTARR